MAERLAADLEHRRLVKELLDDYRATIRCGCNPQLKREWSAFMFQYLGTHIPECPGYWKVPTP